MRTLLKLLLLNLLLCSICYAPPLKPFRGAVLPRGRLSSRGLVGAWFFNEGSGNKVFDLSGRGNTGTFLADTHWVPGKFGSCLEFDGTGDYVNVPEVGNLSVVNSGSGYTCAIWIKVPLVGATISMTFVSKFSGGFEYDFRGVFYTSGVVVYNVQFWVLAGSGAGTTLAWQSPSNYYADRWIHVAFTIDNNAQSGANTRLYENGELKNSEVLIANMGDGDGDLDMGRRGDTLYLNGQLDLPMIYNRALPASEIAELYREPFGMLRPRWNWGVFGTISVVTDVYSGRGVGRGIGRGITR